MIDFADVSFGYGGRHVLEGVTFEVAPASFQLVLGASGAGKSTLLALAHAALVPTRGRMRFFGRATPRRWRSIAELRRAVGLVPQDPPFVPHLSVAENVALPLRVNGVDPASRADDLRALLDWVALCGRGAEMPAALTEVERRRAALARAVILSPRALLIDEPAEGADREAALRMLALLAELNAMGMAILAATREPDLAEAADVEAGMRVLRLEGGRLVPEAVA